MHISLTPELEKIVKDKVASGMYNNASEVIREALRFMRTYETRPVEQRPVRNFNSDIEEGFISLQTEPKISESDALQYFRSKRKNK